jgi:hypothetical protein
MYNCYYYIKLPIPSISELSVISISHSLSPVMKIERSLSLFNATIRKGLYGGLEPAVYVMSAAPGIGKSTGVVEALIEAKTLGFPDNCSILILTNTLAEGQAFVDRAGLDWFDYAFQTSNIKYNKFGAGKNAVNKVPVLFATHSMARRRLGGLSSFEDAADFHYKGKRRSLVLWDESYLPAEYAALGLNDLLMLPGSLHGCPRSDIAPFEGLRLGNSELIAGGTIAIPDAVREVADNVGKSGKKIPERAKQAIDALSKLAGSTATLRRAKDGSWSLVGIGKPMPADMVPMIVLDGSAALTGRYGDWAAYGMTVKHLEPATVDYTPLTIHWWNRGGGLTELSKPEGRRTVFAGIATVANAKPSERFLIIIKKAHCGFDAEGNAILPAELEKAITSPERIKVITWGRHLAVNDYRDFENVILVGSYDYGEAAYDAIASAATGIVPAEVDYVARQRARDGEFMNNVYQAVGRVRVRQRSGALSGTANAYFIMADSSLRRELVHQAFPGVTIEVWTPVAPKKRPKRDIVLEQVLIELNKQSSVTFGAVIKACGSDDRSFLTKVVKDIRFKDALTTYGIRIVSHNFTKMHMTKAAA